MLPLLLSLAAAVPAQRTDPEGLPVRVEAFEIFGRGVAASTLLVGWEDQGPRTSKGVVADWMRVDLQPPEDRPEAQVGRGGGARSPWSLLLADGLVLRGVPVGGDADHLYWRSGQGADSVVIEVDLLWVRGLFRRRLPESAPEQDLLVLRTATGGLDRRLGWLSAVNADGLLFEGPAGDSVHPWERIDALRLLDEAVDGVEQVRAIAVFRDGSMLPFTPIGFDPQSRQLRGRLPWGGRIGLPTAALVALVRRSGPFQDLTVLRPAQVQHPSAEVLDWSPRLGRSVLGRSLSVGAVLDPLGYGVKAPTDLDFVMEAGGCFTARVGVDDESAAQRLPAPLLFEVWFEDQLLGRSEARALGDAAATLRVEIPGPGRLRLRTVCPGAVDGAGSHGDWLEPRLWPQPGAIEGHHRD